MFVSQEGLNAIETYVLETLRYPTSPGGRVDVVPALVEILGSAQVKCCSHHQEPQAALPMSE